MKKEDNKDIQMRHLQMENVRLSNEVVRLESRVRFLEEENRLIEQETREECAVEIDFLKSEVERLNGAQEVAEAAAQANVDYRVVIPCAANIRKASSREILSCLALPDSIWNRSSVCI